MDEIPVIVVDRFVSPEDAPLPEDEGGDESARRHASHHDECKYLERKHGCGYCRLLNKGVTGLVGMVRCRNNTGCPYCRLWNRLEDKEHVVALLSAFDKTHVMMASVAEIKKAKSRIRYAGGEFISIVQPDGETVVASDKPFKGSTATTNVVETLHVAIDRIPDDHARPTQCSHAWSIRRAKPRGFKDEDQVKKPRRRKTGQGHRGGVRRLDFFGSGSQIQNGFHLLHQVRHAEATCH